MFLVGESGVGNGFGGGICVDENRFVPCRKAYPFEVVGNILRVANHVTVHGALALSLAPHELEELAEGSLDCL